MQHTHETFTQYNIHTSNAYACNIYIQYIHNTYTHATLIYIQHTHAYTLES